MIRLAHVCFFLLLSGVALAETEPPPHRVLKLDLETALQKALACNFAIQVDRFDPQIAREDVRKELGAFDPVWDITAERQDNRQREIVIDGKSVQKRTADRVDLLSTGLTGITPLGTKYDPGRPCFSSSNSRRKPAFRSRSRCCAAPARL